MRRTHGAVTLCAGRLDADELARGVVHVLRVPAPEHAPGRVEQDARLLDRGDARLHERARRVRALEDVALRPRVDRHRAAREDRRAVQNADGGGHVVEADVVEHERAVQDAVACRGGTEEDGRVGNHCVDDCLGLSAASVEVKADLCTNQTGQRWSQLASTNLAVVDGHSLECPAPVPVHVNL